MRTLILVSMLSMKRTLFLVTAVVGIAAGAHATTLFVTSNSLTYTVGDTITFNVVGDPQGASAEYIYGRLVYTDLLTDPSGIAPTQNTHTGAGFGTAFTFPLSQGEGYYGPNGFGPGGYSEAFFQSFGFGGPQTVNENTVSVIKVIAAAPGTVFFCWERASLEYFDIEKTPCPAFGDDYTIPGAPITIFAIPEPGTGLLVWAGLLGLAGWRRGRD
jgi:hypothetical protein